MDVAKIILGPKTRHLDGILYAMQLEKDTIRKHTLKIYFILFF